jgi:hypothetical protein
MVVLFLLDQGKGDGYEDTEGNEQEREAAR